MKTAEAAQAVATQTATDATADLATMKAERDTLRESADDKMSMLENAENDLAAARAISTQLSADLAAKDLELTAARTSSPAHVSALRSLFDAITKARDDSVEDARVERASLSDAEARLASSSDAPSAFTTVLRARMEALATSLATSNKALQEALTAETVAETDRLSAEMAIGSFRSDVKGIIGRMSSAFSTSMMQAVSSALHKVGTAAESHLAGSTDRTFSPGSKRPRRDDGDAS